MKKQVEKSKLPTNCEKFFKKSLKIYPHYPAKKETNNCTQNNCIETNCVCMCLYVILRDLM